MKIQKITAAVADEFDLDDMVLTGPIRIRSLRSPLSAARQALYLLLRKHTVLSVFELADALGCEATAITSGEATAKARLADDDLFRRAVDSIERRLAEPEDIGMQELSKAITQLSRIAAKLQHTAKDFKAMLEAQTPKKCCKNTGYKTQETRK